VPVEVKMLFLSFESVSSIIFRDAALDTCTFKEYQSFFREAYRRSTQFKGYLTNFELFKKAGYGRHL